VSKPVKRRRDGSLLVKLPSAGVAMLRDALTGLEATLDPGAPEQVRLFPRAYADDADEAHFQEMTRSYLLESKRSAIRIVGGSLDRGHRRGEIVELILAPDEVTALLGSLNDLRLVIGTLLEVTDDEQPRGLLPPDDPDAARVNSYLWLGAVQETLLETLLEELG